MSAPPSLSKPTISSTRSRRSSKSAPSSPSSPLDRGARFALINRFFSRASPRTPFFWLSALCAGTPDARPRTNRAGPLHRPVLHLQTPHSPELPLVVGDQRQPRRLGVRGNPQVVISDHLALAFQFRSDRSISVRRRFRQAQHGNHLPKLPQRLQRRRALPAFLRPVHQFAKRNHREDCLSLLERAKPSQHLLRLFSPDVNANARVQQEARLHHSPLRFCGLSFSRPASVKSSGNAASRSNARAIVPLRSRRTISSPRREISTSLLFTRNAFGSRTAWLFPDLNTLAVAIFNPPPMYIRQVYTNPGSKSCNLAFVAQPILAARKTGLRTIIYSQTLGPPRL